jgi:hypothetical protein
MTMHAQRPTAPQWEGPATQPAYRRRATDAPAVWRADGRGLGDGESARGDAGTGRGAWRRRVVRWVEQLIAFVAAIYALLYAVGA